MLSLDGTFIVIFISFVVFMFLMRSLYFQPIMAIKTEREAVLEDGRETAETAAQKTVQISKDCQDQLAEARKKAQQVIQKKREQAKQSAAETLAKTREEALRRMEQQSTQLKATREEVYQELQSQREGFTQLIVQKVATSEDSRVAWTP
jgi:F-type H+-transporting ATPase subunit b